MIVYEYFVNIDSDDVEEFGKLGVVKCVGSEDSIGKVQRESDGSCLFLKLKKRNDNLAMNLLFDHIKLLMQIFQEHLEEEIEFKDIRDWWERLE